jgi:hypothetical protein
MPLFVRRKDKKWLLAKDGPATARTIVDYNSSQERIIGPRTSSTGSEEVEKQ